MNRSYEQTKEQALKRLKKWHASSQIPYTGLRRTKETYEAEMGLNAAWIAIQALEREIAHDSATQPVNTGPSAVDLDRANKRAHELHLNACDLASAGTYLIDGLTKLAFESKGMRDYDERKAYWQQVLEAHKAFPAAPDSAAPKVGDVERLREFLKFVSGQPMWVSGDTGYTAGFKSRYNAIVDRADVLVAALAPGADKGQ